jgi:PAS domain S-box-containing protein
MARVLRFGTWLVPIALMKASPRVKIVVFASVLGAYWLAFPWMHTIWGMPSRVFAASYLVLAALLWGLKGGLLVALVNIPVVFSLLKVLGIEHSAPVIAPIITLSLTAVVGRLTDLSVALEVQYVRSSQAEQALQDQVAERQQAEKKFRMLLEATPDAMVVVNGGGEIVLVNAQTERLFGWSREELLGQPVERLVPGHFQPSHPAQRARYRTEPCARLMGAGLNLYGVRQDGSEFPVEISLSPLQTDEEFLVLSAIRDITDRKQAEEALRKAHDELEIRVEERTSELHATNRALEREIAERKQSEAKLRVLHLTLAQKARELEEANADLAQYAYAVSHDLKTPLRGIHYYADFLREDLEASLDGEQKAYLDGLGRAVCQAEELVDGLLELSRVGSRSRAYKAVNLGTLLHDLIASLHVPEDVDIVWEDAWPTIEVEPILLRQVFQNLISNAMKFNRAPRNRVELGWYAVGEHVCELFVRDNGIGIDSRYIEQIFHVFQRLHTQQEYNGAGIGLAIVKKAVSRMGGAVRVVSTPGEGSTFFVTLPMTH